MKRSMKWGAAFSSAVLAAALCPAAALAQDVGNSTARITGLNPGDTVTAYQVFDADIDDANNLTYTAATGLPAEYDTVDELSAANDPATQKAMADAYANAFTNGGAQAANGHTDTAKADAQGNANLANLNSGYWVAVVTSTSGKSVVYQPMTIDATPKTVDGKYEAKTIGDHLVKSEPVTITKGIGDNLAESTDGYSVGQAVPFTVKTNVPSYPANAKAATFTVSDVPAAGLAIDTSSIKVTVGTDTSAVTVYEKGAVTADGEKAFGKVPAPASNGYTFDFAKDYVLTHPGQQVLITYDAKVTSAALADQAKGTTGNTAKVTFNPNPYTDGTYTPEDRTTVQTYGYVFHKTDKGGNALEGATFTLYDAQGNVVQDENKKDLTSTSKTVNGTAYVYFDHLGAGTYTVKETTVPSGKQKAQDFSFTVGSDNAKADNPATTDVTETNYLVNSDGVIDPDQPLLPVTGDTGTFLLTLGGVVLVSASAALYARSRKKER